MLEVAGRASLLLLLLLLVVKRGKLAAARLARTRCTVSLPADSRTVASNGSRS
jgi:hypothetical protein